jgi:GNAT superfamily N-acetyltransferase
MEDKKPVKLTFEAVTKDNWDKFSALFGIRGACANCWCMFYRLKPAEFKEGKVNEINKNRMKELIWQGKQVGIIAIHEGQAIAWCAFAPREDYIKLENSRVHKRIDDKAVWSIPCFFIDKKFRRKGISVALLKGVIEYAKKNKIRIIEAYPTIPTVTSLPDSFVWIGLYKSFERAGFRIVDHKSKSRPMVRYYI